MQTDTPNLGYLSPVFENLGPHFELSPAAITVTHGLGGKITVRKMKKSSGSKPKCTRLGEGSFRLSFENWEVDYSAAWIEPEVIRELVAWAMAS